MWKWIAAFLLGCGLLAVNACGVYLLSGVRSSMPATAPVQPNVVPRWQYAILTTIESYSSSQYQCEVIWDDGTKGVLRTEAQHELRSVPLGISLAKVYKEVGGKLERVETVNEQGGKYETVTTGAFLAHLGEQGWELAAQTTIIIQPQNPETSRRTTWTLKRPIQ